MTTSGAPGAGTLLAGRYRLVQPLAAPRSWRAHDDLNNRDLLARVVALPAQDAEVARQQVLRDAAALARVRNPAVGHVVDSVVQDGVTWLVSELPAGRTLGEVVRRQGPLPSAEVARIGLRVLDALVAAGVPHGDLTPEAVLLGPGGRVVVSGFATAAGGAGTFRVPAGLDGRAADLWALGVTLHVAVEGRLPGGAAERVGELRPVLDGLLTGDPAQRVDLVEARRRLVAATGPVEPAPAPPPAPPAPPAGPAPSGLVDPDIAAALAAFEAALVADGEGTSEPATAPAEPATAGAGQPVDDAASTPHDTAEAGTAPMPDVQAAATPETGPVTPAPEAEATPTPEAGPVPKADATPTPEVTPAPEAEATPTPEAGPVPLAAPARKSTPGTAPVPPAGPAPTAEAGATSEAGPAPTAGATATPVQARDTGTTPIPDVRAAATAGATAAAAEAAVVRDVRPAAVVTPTRPAPQREPADETRPERSAREPHLVGGGSSAPTRAAPHVTGTVRALPRPTPPPVPAGPPPTPPPPPAYEPERPRRPWVGAVAAAVAVLAVLVALLVSLLLRNSDDDPGTAPSATPAASTAPGTSTPSPDAADPPPAGFRRYTDPAGWSVAVPTDWTTRRAGASTTFTDGLRSLTVTARTDKPQDPYEDALRLEPVLKAATPGYDLVRIARVTYRGWPTADWEYRAGSRPVTHTLTRTVVPAGARAYAISSTTRDARWETDRAFFDVAARTFSPAP